MGDKIDWKETGKNIKLLMVEQGYSLTQITGELYISESTMKKYTYGLTKIPVETLCCMTRLLGVEKIEDLLVFI